MFFMFKKIVFLGWLISIISLFLYSFTQVDLSLTLSQFSIYQICEKFLQHIGFFQRPLSTTIFSIIIILLFIFYGLLLYLTKRKKIEIKETKIIIFLTFIILVFSYNAFSYDLFNYIFDAKIITHYHQNPYFHKALDYTGDPMLSFMRWTQRLYPYGPGWLVLTVPLSFIGMNYFLLTFFLFKFLAGFSFVGSCWLIYKISDRIFPEDKLFNLSFWAFNPLVIIESLVSAHNDISMIFFMLLSIYLLIIDRKFLSTISYLFSISIKFATGIFLPIIFFLIYLKKKNKNFEKIFIFSILLSLITVIVASIRTTFQPWYLLMPLSLISFISRKRFIFIASIIVSIFSVGIYIPYVYMTDYAKSYPILIQNIETAGLIILALFSISYSLLRRKLFVKH